MLLKQNDVNLDKLNKWSQTPLSLTSENQHEGVVKILLERKDVNPDPPNTEYGQTSLQSDTTLYS